MNDRVYMLAQALTSVRNAYENIPIENDYFEIRSELRRVSGQLVDQLISEGTAPSQLRNALITMYVDGFDIEDAKNSTFGFSHDGEFYQAVIDVKKISAPR